MQSTNISIPATTNTLTYVASSTSLPTAPAYSAQTQYIILSNPGPTPRSFHYRLQIENSNLRNLRSVQLTGPTTGQFLSLPVGGSTSIIAHSLLTGPDPLVSYGLLLEVDWMDEQGFRGIISQALESATPTTDGFVQ